MSFFVADVPDPNLLSIDNSGQNGTSATTDSDNQIVVDIGLILDFGSSTGITANSCVSMAFSDFYSANPHYFTRLALHRRNSDDFLSAASSALELVNEVQVDAIIGPQNSKQAGLVAEIGGKSQVPIISFSDGTTVLGWHDLVVLYQDDAEEEFGTNFISSLTRTFQQESIHLSYVSAISASSSVPYIRKELRHLRSMQTRVFLVHVTSHDLASRLFSLAREVGMMSKGTAWIITDALSNSISSLNAATIESMEGVLGMRPYIPRSKNLDNFKIKWNLMQQKHNHTEKVGTNIYTCLQAYDTVWALATAAEKIQFQQVQRSSEKLNAPSPAITQIRISETGPRLYDEILKTRFLGLRGEFKLEDGKSETSSFEVINVIGNGYRTVGYWTQKRGFSRKIASTAEEDHEAVVRPDCGENVLKPIIWPGDSTQKPKGWDIPVMPLQLRWRH
ncbi:hypothetical protein ACET3Z_014749 [Daucus carota]